MLRAPEGLSPPSTTSRPDMRTRPLTILILALYAACRLALPTAPPSTALIYQGRLTEGTNVANGLYDLQFTLYDALDGGNLVAGPVTNYLTASPTA